jgi:hypothetical protein
LKFAVDQDQVTLFPVEPVIGSVRRDAVPVDGQVLENEDLFVGIRQLREIVAAVDDQRPCKAGKELRGDRSVAMRGDTNTCAEPGSNSNS